MVGKSRHATKRLMANRPMPAFAAPSAARALASSGFGPRLFCGSVRDVGSSPVTARQLESRVEKGLTEEVAEWSSAAEKVERARSSWRRAKHAVEGAEAVRSAMPGPSALPGPEGGEGEGGVKPTIYDC